MNKKEYFRNYYLKNKERLAKNKHEWYVRNRERVIAMDAEYKRKNRDIINIKRKNHPSYKNHSATRDKEKTRVRKLLRRAVKLGKIKRLPCTVCGDIKSQGHHEDYTKPYDVIWLCSKHHAELHKGSLKIENDNKQQN